MSGEITRESIVEQLGEVKYDRFLFYLMGPYKSFNLNYVLSEEEREAFHEGTVASGVRTTEDDIDDVLYG